MTKSDVKELSVIATVSVTPTDDTTVVSDTPDTNYGNGNAFSVMSMREFDRYGYMFGAIRCNLSRIELTKNVELFLYVKTNALKDNVKLWFSRMIKNWDESNPTWNNFSDYTDSADYIVYFTIPKTLPSKAWLGLIFSPDLLQYVMHDNIFTADMYLGPVEGEDFDLGGMTFHSKEGTNKPYIEGAEK